MPIPYDSTIFERTSDRVWSAIRDFGHYGWAGVPGETVIEDSKSGDATGCVRAFQMNGQMIRQRLTIR